MPNPDFGWLLDNCKVNHIIPIKLRHVLTLCFQVYNMVHFAYVHVWGRLFFFVFLSQPQAAGEPAPGTLTSLHACVGWGHLGRSTQDHLSCPWIPEQTAVCQIQGSWELGELLFWSRFYLVHVPFMQIGHPPTTKLCAALLLGKYSCSCLMLLLSAFLISQPHTV